MENLINYLKDLFTKPQIMWSLTDGIVIAFLGVAVIFLLVAIVWGCASIIDTIKRHKRGKKK